MRTVNKIQQLERLSVDNFEAKESPLTLRYEKETGEFARTEIDVYLQYTNKYVWWLEKKILKE
jgi:hypothetical protein